MLRTLLATALALLLSVAQADDLPLPGDSAPARTVSSSSKPHAKPAQRPRHASASRQHGQRSVHAKQRRAVSRPAKAVRPSGKATVRQAGKHAGKTVKKTLRPQSGKAVTQRSAHVRKKLAVKKSTLHAKKTGKTPRSQLARPATKAANTLKKSVRHPQVKSSKPRQGKGSLTKTKASTRQHTQRQRKRRQ